MMKKHSSLIQRLEKVDPGKVRKGKLARLFTFGCGGSGLSDEAADMIAEVWNFDYMGNARFEDGKVGKAIDDIQNYFINEIAAIGETSVTPRLKLVSGTKTAPQAVPVYYICKGEDEEYLKCLLPDLAVPGKVYTSENPMFDSAVRTISYEKRFQPLLENDSTPPAVRKEIENYVKGHEYVKRLGGWLELDNGFLFFVDKDMYEKSLKLFDINS